MNINISNYFDYSSTTPVLPEVIDFMSSCMNYESNFFGNAGSRSHKFGWMADEIVENARHEVANLIGADIREIIFTSGSTESNNLAIKGLVEMSGKKCHLVTMATEHKSVLDVMKYLEDKGHEITYLQPESNGLLNIDKLEKVIRDDTLLVSIMHVNNEIGVIQDLKLIGNICKNKGVKFHTDATQSIGKLVFNVNQLNVDMVSFSAHKFYGPKGIGVLYLRRKPKVRLSPQLHGGGQERGYRSGTIPVHQIGGFGLACKLSTTFMQYEYDRIYKIKALLLNNLKNIEGVSINGDIEKSSPYILNASFLGVEGESLMMHIEPFAVSSGSACTSSSLEPSYVLSSLGISEELAHSSIRFSFGKYTTEESVINLYNKLKEALLTLRQLSPLWEARELGIENNLPWEKK